LKLDIIYNFLPPLIFKPKTSNLQAGALLLYYRGQWVNSKLRKF